MNDEAPIYSSRLVKNYLEYIVQYYPSMDISSLLDYAGMKKYEVDDPAHWFTQGQTDRFHEILAEKMGGLNISREVGRFSASSSASSSVKQYALGFMNPYAAYRLVADIASHLSKSQTIKVRRLGRNRVEVSATPNPGVHERPFQCENRLGMLEALAKLFTNKLAEVEHPVCVHKGGDLCQYLVTWERMPSLTLRLMRDYSVVFGILTALALFFLLPITAWVVSVLFCGFLTMCFSFYAERFKKRELAEALERQGYVGAEHLEAINVRYRNALLVQEIGQAASTIPNIDELMDIVARTMEKHLDFDRGLIMLSDRKRSRLLCRAGYGYGKGQEELLRETQFNLENQESKGVFALAFREQKPFLVDDISKNADDLSRRSFDLAQQMDVHSLICVPIVCENESLGVLAVDNVRSKRPLTQSDVSLLMGVASQIAVCIVNAFSFRRVEESEKKYRELVENANSIIMRRDTHGNITFFNEFAQSFFGYSEEEILGRNVVGTIVPSNDSGGRDLAAMIRDIGLHPGRYVTNENENMKRNGERVWVAWTNKAIYDEDGRVVEMLCIGNDITKLKQAAQEKRELDLRLQRAQKMEAIGTLAGGVAHDLNNILSGLVSYPELLLMDLPQESPLRKPLMTIKKSGERAANIVQDLLTLARRGVSVTEVVDLNQIVSDYLKSPEYESLKLYHPGVYAEMILAEDLLNIAGSPVHLSKTIMNLVINAAEAMPGGGKILITTRNQYVDRPIKGYDDVEEGDYAVLSVSDTGVGIPPKDMERIFEPFYTKKAMGRSGTGLGMAVVWGAVKDHKGYIDVQSVEGKGAAFTLYFPVTRRELENTPFPLFIESYMGKGEAILVVDDVEEQREIASELLRRLGYSVVSVSSGEEAVDYLKDHSADLLMLDMIMDPGIDGLETYKKIIESHPDQKAIIVSGFSETERVREAERLGVGAYVKKPYLLERMGLAVRKELDK